MIFILISRKPVLAAIPSDPYNWSWTCLGNLSKRQVYTPRAGHASVVSATVRSIQIELEVPR